MVNRNFLILSLVVSLRALLCVCPSSLAAQEIPPYGKYDVAKVLVPRADEQTPPSLDGKQLDKLLRDLWSHARSYPPKFANKVDEERARSDAAQMASVFDVLDVVSSERDPALVFQAARLYVIAHNLDLKGNAAKADACYERLLKTTSKKGRIHYDYGVFLAGSARPKSAVPHLTKAIELGQDGAAFSLAMTHLTMGNEEEAKSQLESFLEKHPDNKKALMVLDAINSGSIEMKAK